MSSVVNFPKPAKFVFVDFGNGIFNTKITETQDEARAIAEFKDYHPELRVVAVVLRENQKNSRVFPWEWYLTFVTEPITQRADTGPR